MQRALGRETETKGGVASDREPFHFDKFQLQSVMVLSRFKGKTGEIPLASHGEQAVLPRRILERELQQLRAVKKEDKEAAPLLAGMRVVDHLLPGDPEGVRAAMGKSHRLPLAAICGCAQQTGAEAHSNKGGDFAERGDRDRQKTLGSGKVHA